MQFTLQLPTRVYFGENQMHNLVKELKQYNKVLFLYGGGSIKKSGLYDQIISLFNEVNISFVEYAGVESNPRYSTVVAAAQLCAAENVDLVLGVGGGSVIDCAKSVAMQAKNLNETWELFKQGKSITDALHVGAVLTLAATGSESNVNSVITNWETQEKIGYSSPLLRPRFAILDPVNTLTVPRTHTIYGVVDTMAHLLEQYFTPKTTDDKVLEYLLTRIEYMLKACMELAPKLANDLHNVKLREEIMYYAYEALNGEFGPKTGGDWASHVIEHGISAIYDVAHGAGLSIVFPQWIKNAAATRPERVLRLAKNVFGSNEISDAWVKLSDFFRSVDAPVTFREENIDSPDIDRILEAVYARDSKIGKYVELTKEDVRTILENAR